MKKIILSVAVLVGLGLSQVNAQTMSGGVKAEANLSNFILTDLPAFNSNMGFGASVGGFMKIDFGQYFAVQPELLFHFKTSTMETKLTGIELDYQYFGVEIPIYAVGQMNLWDGRAYLGIGPYVGLGFDAKYKMDNVDDIDLYKKDDLSDKAVMQRWDFGAGAMLGYEFKCGLQINAGYKIGFINALDAGSDNATMLNQTVSLGLGYRF